MIPPIRHREEPNTDSWLMSYADMITLLLCFFIIFVSVSEPKKDKLQEISEGMANKFGSVDLSTPLQGLFRSLNAIVENQHLLQDVAINKDQTTIEVEFSTVSFFQPGTADFAPDKIPALTELAATLKSGSLGAYRISIEGHTSDVKINSPRYPSNWEFSSARAARMARFLIEQGIAPDHLKVVGYGDSQPKVPNLDASGSAIYENRTKNERIVLKLERLS